jgi:glycogen operon protein
LATLLISQGVPMIRSGDEIGHTQRGNNNSYCQDNDINWLNWNLDATQQAILDFVRQLIRFRQQQPVLTRRQFFQGRQIRGDATSDIRWLKPTGLEMQASDWGEEPTRVFGVQMNGKMIDEVDDRGRPITGRTLLILFNSEDEATEFVLPALKDHEYWKPLINTAQRDSQLPRIRGGSEYQLASRSLALFGQHALRPRFLSRFLLRPQAARPTETVAAEPEETEVSLSQPV